LPRSDKEYTLRFEGYIDELGETVTRSRSSRMAIASLAAFSLIAAACGGDDDDDVAETATESAPAETDAPETTVADTSAPATDAPGTTAPALEPQTIKVGFAWPDLAAFEQVSPAYGVGDQEQQLLAVLESWREDGTLPINGVDIEPVFQKFDSLDAESKLSACQTFGEAGDVFAVLGARIFTEGAECLATRYQIPVIDTDQAPTSLLEGAAPYMFTLKPSTNDSVTMLANWAVDNGYLEGKKVGLFWESQHAEAADLFKSMIGDAGVELASEIESGGQGSVGSEQDALAAQRFAADGVDLVVFLVGSSSIVNFLQAADDQGYKPGYVDFEWASHMSDVAAGAYNANQWGGVPALSATTIGDLPDLDTEAEECIANYETFSGTTIDRTPPEKSGEFSNILLVCDLATILLEGLKAATATGELTAESLIAGLESLQDVPASWIDTISFSADKHTAPATVREVSYDAACPCWKGTGDWLPVADFLD
jgi:ABC-type branched-subunit amino acid transport system substrate-binding protein